MAGDIFAGATGGRGESMKILAIESTCDETGAAVVEDVGGRVEVLSNVVASSAELQQKYGGIVPEVAAREQIRSIIPVIREALEKIEGGLEGIDGVAVAVGPGLIGSLLIGVETAKAIAVAMKKPLIKVNHMAGHIYANWIGYVPELPAVALVVSGGHTDLVLLKTIIDWEWIGGTRDDAAGECFDKAARLLGLPYPGGPAMERAAAEGEIKVENKLPRPMIYEDSLEMSFSGLKSALESMVRKRGIGSKREVADLALEVSQAVVEVLVNKTMKAVDMFEPKSVLLAGGVAASKRLREALRDECEKRGLNLYMPEFKYCTDNAAMIGAAAVLRREFRDPLLVTPESGLETV